VRRHDLLQRLHELLQPRSYLEIGVSSGASMTLSRARSIGVDPAFHVERELWCDLHLVRATSDEFFARRHPLAHFDEPAVDLAFIDGMHLAEYALRDFVNTERLAHAASVIVLDDMLPRHPDEAGRNRALGRVRGAWAGDVFKVVETLRELRPDLVVLEVDTQPTGTVLVLNPDAASEVLATAYDDLVEAYVTPDPQQVPDAILNRSRAVDPDVLLAAPIWEGLRRLRVADPVDARAHVASLLGDAALRTPR
jgi:hypothetical protein